MKRAAARTLWPDDVLDVPALRAAGRRPVPFQEFVVKVHSRCNLACDYCYVYQAADRGWRAQPHVMSHGTAEHVCRRIAEHAERHALPSVRVILHGGEPLLAGAEFLGGLARRLRTLLPVSTAAEVTIQTNGTLVDEAVLTMCHEQGLRLGVSLDGDAAVHDRHRRDAGGRGTHARTAAVLHRLARPEHRAVSAGILCTVDVTADPLATYAHLLSYRPPAIRFLLPLGNWTHRPPGRVPDARVTPYADWLIPVFDQWYGSPAPPVRLPLFESMLDLLLGGATSTESLGGGPSRLAVVDTDGTLALSDHLKTAADGADRTGHDVFSDPFDSLLDHPGVVARQLGPEGLCAQCRGCPVRTVCGGGHYAHRYRADSGYLHPSVYCPDLMDLIGYVSRVVRADLDRLRTRRGEH
ncbi:FxsB family cyclophane-forming radical SAM/SPASM peptide maturase [Streptomyces sp. DSM 44917]|uniref:FxsB family cyclophane-forming radical SAM/SPASM peptide maturase n=1 Tax=Streptomyces boetiae TaxID=3075541 RepID=A0ABU2LG15_9ACTN|nr:FxsB family cyclophane-forming radical SAM/SPASM peptide maturase [Streptomyces sp. DSM 44917]MDT0310529.1 FxsB family cyclophane-forming radical SAM/SPASM peptide maturase [Streptomyces sp. DSM 44917]